MKTIYKILICLLILAIPDLMLFENNALGFEPFSQSGFITIRLVCLIISGFAFAFLETFNSNY